MDVEPLRAAFGAVGLALQPQVAVLIELRQGNVVAVDAQRDQAGFLRYLQVFRHVVPFERAFEGMRAGRQDDAGKASFVGGDRRRLAVNLDILRPVVRIARQRHPDRAEYLHALREVAAMLVQRQTERSRPCALARFAAIVEVRTFVVGRIAQHPVVPWAQRFGDGDCIRRRRVRRRGKQRQGDSR